MPYKVCPSCQQVSYSACTNGTWLCPYCGKELTLSKAIHDHRKLPQLSGKQRQGQTSAKIHIFPQK